VIVAFAELQHPGSMVVPAAVVVLELKITFPAPVLVHAPLTEMLPS